MKKLLLPIFILLLISISSGKVFADASMTVSNISWDDNTKQLSFDYVGDLSTDTMVGILKDGTWPAYNNTLTPDTECNSGHCSFTTDKSDNGWDLTGGTVWQIGAYNPGTFSQELTRGDFYPSTPTPEPTVTPTATPTPTPILTPVISPTPTTKPPYKPPLVCKWSFKVINILRFKITIPVLQCTLKR